jgi:hypothetical protein
VKVHLIRDAVDRSVLELKDCGCRQVLTGCISLLQIYEKRAKMKKLVKL